MILEQRRQRSHRQQVGKREWWRRGNEVLFLPASELLLGYSEQPTYFRARIGLLGCNSGHGVSLTNAAVPHYVLEEDL